MSDGPAKSKRRIPIWALLILLAIGGVIMFVAGLFTYISVTAVPIHPDAAKIQSAVETPPPAEWADAAEQARRIARSAAMEQNLPGLSVAVGFRGDLVWAEGFGQSDLEEGVAIAPRMRFRIADLSRTLTSAAVGLLVDRNKLDLDADVRTYVPEFPQKPWPVTLRQLMSQTAGLIQDQGDEEPIDEHCTQTTEAFSRFAKHDLLFEPGTQYHESSYGWIVVSAAVEAAARRPFFSFMRSEILAPLQMNDTLPDSEPEPPANRATFYFPRFAGDTRYGPELTREGDYSCFAGAYAFLSTPSDLVRFAMAIEAGKLLQPATVQALQTPQKLKSGEVLEAGLGWHIETLSLAGQSVRMAGMGTKRDFLGGTAYLMTFPDRGLDVALTSNISFADLKSVAMKIADAFAARTPAASGK